MLWRDPRCAGWLMTGYFLLSLAVGPDGFVRIDTGPVGPGAALYGALAAAFFAWRVTRGGRISRMLLIVVTGLAFAVTAVEIAPRFGPAVFAVLLACAAQLALLLSPAVYRRTRPRDYGRPEPGWTRVRPPLSLLLLGLLAGLLVTLIGLSHLGVQAAPCDSDASGACLSAVDGYPVRWLAAAHGALIVNWPAMLKDLVQYSVICTAVLYAGWLGPRTRPAPALPCLPFGIIACSVLGGLTLSAATGGIPWTWVSAGNDVPLYTPPALAADTAVWSLAGLGGCLAIRALLPASGRPSKTTAKVVRPADDGA